VGFPLLQELLLLLLVLILGTVIRKGTVVFLGALGPIARELQWQKPLKS
jgi:uncharacterized membrane protein YczE